MKLMEDNMATMELIRNGKLSQRTKHIDIRAHFIRDVYEAGKVDVQYCPSDKNLADGFTKSLTSKVFQNLFDLIMRREE